jgi:membrane associated rhomboid family serine protease
MSFEGTPGAFDVVVDPQWLFARRLLAAIRQPARATRVLLAANAAMFVLVFTLPWLSGVPAAQHDLARDVWTLALGAKVDLLVQSGQWWRLATALFLHAGLLHLALNLLALNFLGQVFEGVFGVARFVLVYLVSGLGASLASLLLSDSPSVGASGAIFGVLGGVAVFAVRHRAVLGGPLRKHFLVNPLLWIVLNVAAGLVIPRIDQAAHGGGLVTGVLVTSLLADRVGFRAPGALASRLVAALDVALVAVVMACLVVGVSQVVTGIRAPTVHWQRVTVDDVRVLAPEGWREGLEDGGPCADEEGRAPLVCRSGPLAGRFLAIHLDEGERVEPSAGRFERDGSVFYAVVEDERTLYLMVFPAFLEPMYADLWRTFPPAAGQVGI